MRFKVPDFNKTKILVVGDVMLDKYIYGETSRISPEAPVPVVTINNEENRLGGASNVALNLSTIGCNVALMGIAGKDPESDLINKILDKASIENHIIQSKNILTTLKTRVVSSNQQILRFDREKKFLGSENEQLFSNFKKILNEFDIVIFSDYDKGVLEEISKFIDFSKKTFKPIIIDPKQANYLKYKGASLITPNFKEFEQMVGKINYENEIKNKGLELISKLDLEGLLITRGEKGITLIERNGSLINNDSLALDVYDITGAGDTLIAITSACIASKMSFEDSVLLANFAAGKVVSKFGTATITNQELCDYFEEKTVKNNNILNLNQLKKVVKYQKNIGNKVVMTNGCFDILHPGHTYYLQEAKKLGDKLVVAVNSDSSVRNLKGEGRPINSLNDRMMILSSLSFVDWVIAFNENTPELIINEIEPDILVKGSDYKISQIAGADKVLSYGGEVKTIDFLKNKSSSNIIKNIKNS